MAELFCRKIAVSPHLQDGSLGGNIWALVGADDDSQETLAKLPEKHLKVKATAPRNLAYLRFYWAMLGRIVRNLPDGVTLDVEGLHDVIKMKCGYTRKIKIPPDTFYEIPRSIAIDKMDETAFRAFMDKAVPVITTDLVPGWDSDVLMNEVYAFLGGQ